MLRIDCPHCGVRDETEFRFGGETAVVRPSGSDYGDWTRYLYWRRNVAGEQSERWLHVSGCLRWLEVRRDTRTNTILAVREANSVTAGTPPP
jgi:heterotetrameric sarcosine oxidase delta subunit